jgi:mannuronan 5-epimerase
MIKLFFLLLSTTTTLLLFSLMIQTISSQEYSRCISYDQKNNAIDISCDTDISQADRNLRNKALLLEESDGVWILNASMIIDKDATLTISSDDTKWLKITNYGDNNPNSINVSGKAKINGVRITSWDSSNNDVIKQNNNGSIPRPFIYIERDAGPVDILNSEIAFLGYRPSPGQGISYHGGNGSNISNNIFHHLWYGFYSNSIENVTIIDIIIILFME